MFLSQIRMLPARPALTGLVLALAIAACGGSAATSPQPPEGQVPPVADPVGQDAPGAPPAASAAAILAEAGGLCAEIPVAPAELALGLPLVSARFNEGDAEWCRLIANDEAFIDVERGGETTLDDFEDSTEAVGMTDAVVGLGESAYRREGTVFRGPGARLAVFTGIREFHVNVYAAGDQAVMFDASETIARAVIEAVP